MPQIELSAGTIEYTDTGSGGPVIVLLYGLLMDATLWDEVTAALSPGHRCVAPTLPLGAHRHAMKVGADLSLPAFDRPALVVWAAGDRVMPPEHGRRLAGLLADARLLEIPDTYTLIPSTSPLSWPQGQSLVQGLLLHGGRCAQAPRWGHAAMAPARSAWRTLGWSSSAPTCSPRSSSWLREPCRSRWARARAPDPGP
jgi:pimeloyl-ACP methyl ester carboxylesterase